MIRAAIGGGGRDPWNGWPRWCPAFDLSAHRCRERPGTGAAGL